MTFKASLQAWPTSSLLLASLLMTFKHCCRTKDFSIFLSTHVLPFPNITEVVSQPDMAWANSRCFLSEPISLYALFTLQVCFERGCSTIMSFKSSRQWYRSMFIMSVSSATTITTLLVAHSKGVLYNGTLGIPGAVDHFNTCSGKMPWHERYEPCFIFFSLK